MQIPHLVRGRSPSLRNARRTLAACLALGLSLGVPLGAAQTPAPVDWVQKAEENEAKVEAHPNDGRAWLGWGQALLELGEPQDALAKLERADHELVNAPLLRGQARFALARTQATLGARDAALDWLARALQWGFSDLAAFEKDAALAKLAQDERYRHLHDELRALGEPRLDPNLPVALEAPVAPNPFRAQGKCVLSYDLFVSGLWPTGVPFELRAEELTVLDAASGAELARYSGDALTQLIERPNQPVKGDPRQLGGNTHFVASLWIELDPAAPLPRALEHRLRFSGKNFWNVPFQPVVEGAPVAVGSPAPVLGAPLHGAGWVARASGSASYHRRGGHAYLGALVHPQRFAIDWARNEDLAADPSAGRGNEAFAGYGQDVLAVADGVVVEAENDLPDNVPNEPPLIVPAGKVCGNHVVLDLGQGRFATYAHLKAGSVRVRSGERVSRGQVIAALGDSGDATSPHLHFHLSTGATPLTGQGLPYVLDSFDVLGWEHASDAQAGKPAACDLATRDHRRGEMPVDGAVVRLL